MEWGTARIVLLIVIFQRLVELALARSNQRRLLARGGVEHGAGHYPWLVALHAGWLAALFAFVPAAAPIDRFWMAVFLALQALRYWVIASLGPCWTTRIISVPGAKLVRRGPYRFLRHPNYAVVAAEIAVLPLALGAVWIAAAFTVANAVLLRIRIEAEDAALAPRRGIDRGQACI